MPTRQEFLGAVLPPTGFYCVVGIGNKTVHSQTFHATLSDVDVAIDALDEAGINSFFAVASYGTSTNRTAVNATRLRSFFLDLDCDPNNPKKYANQAEAVADLKLFTKELRLPRPYVINSGNGVHAYWPLTEAVSKEEWKPVAEKIKTTCLMRGMKIDPAVPADVARILRAVGSKNFKNPADPRPVEILVAGSPVEFEKMKELFGVADDGLPNAIRRPLDEATKALLENRPSSFKLILKKSAAGKGCNQILSAVVDQANTPEPLWRAVLSIAKFCKDKDKAIHAISCEHPDYSREETEKKVELIQGPYNCESFWKDNPQGCAGCIHKDKIKNPINLGRGEVEVATPEDNIVHDVKEPERTYVIPEYPFPYVRGKRGGVYVRSKDEDDNPKDMLVYDNDFYLVNTVDDPMHGMSGLFRLHLPQDGVKEFIMPMKELAAKDSFAKTLAHHGVSALGKQMEALMHYVAASIKDYQKRSKAEKSRLQMGWADNYSAFIVGDRQIMATDIGYSPPSSHTLDLVKPFRKLGSLDEWKKIASFYNRPGMELHMFVLFSAFSSPLVQFSPKPGGIISLYSDESGTGKTTMLHMINSVFGHPEDLMIIKADTLNARMHRIGIMHNITPTIDEITNESPEYTSEFIYTYLHARFKDRMQGNANRLRLNTTTWRANCVVTANAPIEDKLLLKKRNPDGELARILEFPYQPGNDVSKQDSDAVFNQLKFNYGVAGEPYMQYVIRELNSCVKSLDKMQQSLDQNAGLTQRERYWSNIATTTMTGGLVARSAGVLDYSDSDYRRVYDWAVEMLSKKRAAVPKSNTEPKLMLGAFLSEHINDALIIMSGTTRKSGAPQDAPIREPKGKLYIRYEPDTKILYVNKPRFREFCSQGQVSYHSVLDALTKAKVFLGEKKMRMGKGMQFSQPESVLTFTNDGEKLFPGDDIDTKPRDTD